MALTPPDAAYQAWKESHPTGTSREESLRRAGFAVDVCKKSLQNTSLAMGMMPVPYAALTGVGITIVEEMIAEQTLSYVAYQEAEGKLRALARQGKYNLHKEKIEALHRQMEVAEKWMQAGAFNEADAAYRKLFAEHIRPLIKDFEAHIVELESESKNKETELSAYRIKMVAESKADTEETAKEHRMSVLSVALLGIACTVSLPAVLIAGGVTAATMGTEGRRETSHDIARKTQEKELLGAVEALKIELGAYRSQVKILKQLAAIQYFFLGLTELKQRKLDDAVLSFNAALSFNEVAEKNVQVALEIREYRALTKFNKAFSIDKTKVAERRTLRDEAMEDAVLVLEKYPDCHMLRAYQCHYLGGEQNYRKAFSLVNDYLEKRKRIGVTEREIDIEVFLFRANLRKKLRKYLLPGVERTLWLRDALEHDYAGALQIASSTTYSRHEERKKLLLKAFELAKTGGHLLEAEKLAWQMLKIERNHEGSLNFLCERNHPLAKAFKAYYILESFLNKHSFKLDREGLTEVKYKEAEKLLEDAVAQGNPYAKAWRAMLFALEGTVNSHEKAEALANGAITEASCEWAYYVKGHIYDCRASTNPLLYADVIRYYKEAKGVPQAYYRLALLCTPGAIASIPEAMHDESLGKSSLRKAVAYGTGAFIVNGKDVLDKAEIAALKARGEHVETVIPSLDDRTYRSYVPSPPVVLSSAMSFGPGGAAVGAAAMSTGSVAAPPC